MILQFVRYNYRFLRRRRKFFLGIISNDALLASAIGQAKNAAADMMSAVEKAMENAEISFNLIDNAFNDCGRVYRLEAKEDYVKAKLVLPNIDNVTTQYAVQFGYKRYIK